MEFKASMLGHYPQHWVAHIMHAAEVIGYRHPDGMIAQRWFNIYREMVHGLHLNPEGKQQMIERLSEDRVATGTVVS